MGVTGGLVVGLVGEEGGRAGVAGGLIGGALGEEAGLAVVVGVVKGLVGEVRVVAGKVRGLAGVTGVLAGVWGGQAEGVVEVAAGGAVTERLEAVDSKRGQKGGSSNPGRKLRRRSSPHWSRCTGRWGLAVIARHDFRSQLTP